MPFVKNLARYFKSDFEKNVINLESIGLETVNYYKIE